MRFFYTLGVQFYHLGIWIASFWNSKAKKRLKGAKQTWQQLSDFEPGKTVYWFHCASLGEFEQGRPLMEEIRDQQKCQIVVTFFSPSGYEIRKNYPGADRVVYLPKDSKKNAKRFLDLVQPDYAFFIKYEFWANYLLSCEERGIPVFSVAALFRKDQIFFKRYGGFMRSVLHTFDKIFVQNEASKKLLEDIDVSSEVCGDTRYDRVMKNAEQVQRYPEIKVFCGEQPVLICGSIWSEDLEVIHPKINELKDWKVIIAPHEISEKFISQIERQLKIGSIRYSKMGEWDDEQVLIIDNIGMLMNLYQYGQVAYIGGAFRTGLHNILEPAAFGLPVIFGNQYDKFPEASTFIENGIGFSVNDSLDFETTFNKVVKSNLEDEVITFMRSQKGATQQILQRLTE